MKPKQLARKFGFPTPAYVGGGISACMATITPEIGKRILAEHHMENNRKRKPASIAMYREDMEPGHWSLTHQGIAFGTDGKLSDGQNRLETCVQSGTAFTTLVFFGLDPQALINVDSGVKRTIADAARIAGHDVNSRWGSMVRVIALGPTTRKFSNAATLAAAKILKESVEFVGDAFPSHIKRVTIQPVYGAVGRAYYCVPRKALRRFCEVLRTSSASDNAEYEKTIIRLRGFLTDGAGAGHGYNLVAYSKTCAAIDAFTKKKRLQRLNPASTDLYQLPAAIGQQLSKARVPIGVY